MHRVVVVKYAGNLNFSAAQSRATDGAQDNKSGGAIYTSVVDEKTVNVYLMGSPKDVISMISGFPPAQSQWQSSPNGSKCSHEEISRAISNGEVGMDEGFRQAIPWLFPSS